MNEQKQIAYGSASERKKKLLAEKPGCPNCINPNDPGQQKVLLTNQFLVPAVWKCKFCDCEFTYEPI